MRLSLIVCALLVGIGLPFGGCLHEARQTSGSIPIPGLRHAFARHQARQKEIMTIPGTLRCTVAGVAQSSCRCEEFLDAWEITLTVKLKLENNTAETLSLQSAHFDLMLSDSKVRARDKTGHIHELLTLRYGKYDPRIIEYAVRDLKPKESCFHNAICEVVAFSRDEPPPVGLEWLFPGYKGWFGGEMAIPGSMSVPCEFGIEVIGNAPSWEPLAPD